MIKIYDIWAEWCQPCKKFGPIFQSVSEKFPDIEFIKINADEDHVFLDAFGIRSIPTILILNENLDVIFQHAGILPEASFEALVRTYAAY